MDRKYVSESKTLKKVRQITFLSQKVQKVTKKTIFETSGRGGRGRGRARGRGLQTFLFFGKLLAFDVVSVEFDV